MEQVFEVEAMLRGDLADLYAALMEEFEKKSEISLGEMNQALLQTGLFHHLVMMGSLGMMEAEKKERIDEVIDRVAAETIMSDLVKQARVYWQQHSGSSGTVDLNG
tara:strand:- start:134 stop:451 length:318 start_codon:yes stop_codon:yes gene_type:complete